jgi:hypothetical protein
MAQGQPKFGKDEAERLTIERAVYFYRAGLSQQNVAYKLIEEGHTSRFGGPIRGAQVRKWVSAELALAGEEFNDAMLEAPTSPTAQPTPQTKYVPPWPLPQLAPLLVRAAQEAPNKSWTSAELLAHFGQTPGRQASANLGRALRAIEEADDDIASGNTFVTVCGVGESKVGGVTLWRLFVGTPAEINAAIDDCVIEEQEEQEQLELPVDDEELPQDDEAELEAAETEMRTAAGSRTASLPPATITQPLLDTMPSSHMPALVQDEAFYLERIVSVLERTDKRFAGFESRLVALEKSQAASADLLLEQLADFSAKTVDITKGDLVDAVKPLGEAAALLHTEQRADVELLRALVEEKFKTVAARLETQAERMLPLAALTHLDEHITDGIDAILGNVLDEKLKEVVSELQRANLFLRKNADGLSSLNREMGFLMDGPPPGAGNLKVDVRVSQIQDVLEAAKANPVAKTACSACSLEIPLEKVTVAAMTNAFVLGVVDAYLFGIPQTCARLCAEHVTLFEATVDFFDRVRAAPPATQKAVMKVLVEEIENTRGGVNES